MKFMKFLGVVVLSTFICIACASSNTEKEISVAKIAKSYKTLKRMTKEPVPVNPQIAMLCRGASQEEIAQVKKEKGPHAMTYVHMYMNEMAAKAFVQKPFSFPVGSVIVKDKSGNDDGVGGMIKRKAGYDSKHGDWEYFYFTKIDKIESGKIVSCVTCHSLKAKTDYVYGDWAARSINRRH
jgi:hypothetical protein